MQENRFVIDRVSYSVILRALFMYVIVGATRAYWREPISFKEKGALHREPPDPMRFALCPAVRGIL